MDDTMADSERVSESIHHIIAEKHCRDNSRCDSVQWLMLRVVVDALFRCDVTRGQQISMEEMVAATKMRRLVQNIIAVIKDIWVCQLCWGRHALAEHVERLLSNLSAVCGS